MVTVLILQGLLAQPAAASQDISPTLHVQDLRVIVSYVSNAEFAQLVWKYGARIDVRDVRQGYRHGLSILKTNRETGGRTCEIFLPNQFRPGKVDDDGTLTLGHELLHCMLGNYHR